MAEDLLEINHGTILVLALNRPERRNSMDLEVTRSLASSLERAAGNKSVNAIVLQGYSHGFSAGSDLKALTRRTINEMIADEDEMAALARSFNRHPKPIIAAVDGYAIGGGAIYAASCDVVFSSAEAKWAFPEVPIGWNAAYGIATLQVRLGASLARHVLWGVEEFTGETAFKIGLADFLVKRNATDAALDYAKHLAALPPQAVTATKQLCAHPTNSTAVELDDRAMSAFARCLSTDTAQATLQKFGMVKKHSREIP